MSLSKFFVITALLSVSVSVKASVFAGGSLQLENLGPGGNVYPNTTVNIDVPSSGVATLNYGTAWNRPSPVVISVFDTGPNSAVVTLAETLSSGGTYPTSVALFTSLTSSIPPFANVTLNPLTTSALFDPNRVQFTNTSFSFDFGGLPIINGGFVQMDISTSPVPEPAAVWLLVSGLASFGLFGQRRKKS